MPANDRKPSTSMRAIAPADFGYDQARHLLWRAGFGGTPEQIGALAAMGPARAVDLLLAAGEPGADDPEGRFDDGIMLVDETSREEYRRAQRAGDEETLARLRLRRQTQQRSDREQVRRMQRWWLERLIETPRPLEEKMTLFWHGRLATSYRKIENSTHMLLQNRMFRAHALGNVGSLLFALIRDPAMLAYLDNHTSVQGRPNENLARELMELFALGEGAYTERDIREGARALTGYTFEGNAFVFRPAWHDAEPKAILGATGNLDGDGFVRAILGQRRCAEFLAWGLHRFFVNAQTPPLADLRDDPGASAAVREMTRALLAARYDVAPALRTLFLSEYFYDPANVGVQIKSPIELIVGAVRSLGAPPRDLSILSDAAARMGQELFFPPSVAGWEGGRSWINTSTLFVRQNTLVFLLTGRLPEGREAGVGAEPYDPTPLLRDLAASSPGAERDWSRVIPYLLRLTLGRASEQRTATLSAFAEGRDVAPASLTGALALITSCPEYQLC